MEKLLLKILLMLPWEKIIAQLSWDRLRPMLYIFCKSVVLPLIRKYVEDTSSKWDDNMYRTVEMLVEYFLGPQKAA